MRLVTLTKLCQNFHTNNLQIFPTYKSSHVKCFPTLDVNFFELLHKKISNVICLKVLTLLTS